MTIVGYVKCSSCGILVQMSDCVHISGSIMKGVYGSPILPEEQEKLESDETQDVVLCSMDCIQAYFSGCGVPKHPNPMVVGVTGQTHAETGHQSVDTSEYGADLLEEGEIPLSVFTRTRSVPGGFAQTPDDSDDTDSRKIQEASPRPHEGAGSLIGRRQKTQSPPTEDDPIARRIFGDGEPVSVTRSGLVWNVDDPPPPDIADAIGLPSDQSTRKNRRTKR